MDPADRERRRPRWPWPGGEGPHHQTPPEQDPDPRHPRETRPTNLALNKPATASSTENAGTPAADAVDGNTGTRWSSAFSDPQWLEVDLGSSQAICQVVLQWETAYATAFQIQTSADGTTWTTI